MQFTNFENQFIQITFLLILINAFQPQVKYCYLPVFIITTMFGEIEISHILKLCPPVQKIYLDKSLHSVICLTEDINTV